MKNRSSDQYLKIVEWSKEDGCYVGTAPGLIIGGVHGDREADVFLELCRVVDDAIEIFKKEGRPLPPATAGRKYSGKISLRISPDLHKSVAIRAIQYGESINKYIQGKLEESL
jgi:predicted HicB family RNase H-like nuclease